MCGICGVFVPDRSSCIERDDVAEMNRRIAHRGPDDEGFFFQPNIALAMRRLSIIDIKSGHQPLSNEIGNIWIVFNGEIYNHKQLKDTLENKSHRFRTRSDTETVVHAYEEYGRDCVKHLRGMFAFAIWDGRKRILFAARDRLGIKPFYYRWDHSTFIFGSEIKAILAHPQVKAEFNRGALAEYLSFGYVTGPATMFKDIRKLPPAHTLELAEDGILKIEPYWALVPADHVEILPREFYVEKYREMLEDAVRSHLMSDVPLGVFLSGGLDSSTIAALATRIRGDQIKTFSVGYGSDSLQERKFSEFGAARQVATHIQSDHYEVSLGRDEFFNNLPHLIWHEDEPIVWPSSVALFSVAKLAREHVSVVLTGEGSDETLAGYTRYPWTLANVRLDGAYRALTTVPLRRTVQGLLENMPLGASFNRKLKHTFLCRDGTSWPCFYFDNFFSAFSAVEQQTLLKPEVLEAAGHAYENPMLAWDKSQGELLNRLLHTDLQSYLVELLMKQDQMSMAASLESRVPFLDHELVEFALQIPSPYLTKGMTGKSILKAAVADLLPRSIIHRRKMGFPTPWKSWLTGTKLDYVESLLLGSLNRGLFVEPALQRLFTEYRSGKRDHSDKIWRLLNLELWQRIFLDSQNSETALNASG